MSTTKRGIVANVCKELNVDANQVRLHVDMFLAGVGRELAAGKAVNIKHFGILTPDGGAIQFTPSPTMVRGGDRKSDLAAVITGIGEDAIEDARQSLRVPVREEPN